jgi:hypothetical protein
VCDDPRPLMCRSYGPCLTVRRRHYRRAGPTDLRQRRVEHSAEFPVNLCRVPCTADCGAGVPPVSRAGTAVPQLSQLLTQPIRILPNLPLKQRVNHPQCHVWATMRPLRGPDGDKPELAQASASQAACRSARKRSRGGCQLDFHSIPIPIATSTGCIFVNGFV